MGGFEKIATKARTNEASFEIVRMLYTVRWLCDEENTNDLIKGCVNR